MLWQEKVIKYLNKLNISSLRAEQENVINEILLGNDVIGLLPTGYGKSLCYILPPLLKRKVIFVISPLISLMDEQCNKLLEKGVSRPDIDALINGVKIDCAESRKRQRRLGLGAAYADNRKYDAITRYHPPRPKNTKCTKPINCPKCNETPVCTSNGWTCETMRVPVTNRRCIQ